MPWSAATAALRQIKPAPGGEQLPWLGSTSTKDGTSATVLLEVTNTTIAVRYPPPVSFPVWSVAHYYNLTLGSGWVSPWAAAFYDYDVRASEYRLYALLEQLHVKQRACVHFGLLALICEADSLLLVTALDYQHQDQWSRRQLPR
jgi:hypothetical protein